MSESPPIEVAERILAEPLSAIGLDEDIALKVTEVYLALNGNMWVISYGKPCRDEHDSILRGVQEARERVLETWAE